MESAADSCITLCRMLRKPTHPAATSTSRSAPSIHHRTSTTAAGQDAAASGPAGGVCSNPAGVRGDADYERLRLAVLPGVLAGCLRRAVLPDSRFGGLVGAGLPLSAWHAVATRTACSSDPDPQWYPAVSPTPPHQPRGNRWRRTSVRSPAERVRPRKAVSCQQPRASQSLGHSCGSSASSLGRFAAAGVSEAAPGCLSPHRVAAAGLQL